LTRTILSLRLFRNTLDHTTPRFYDPMLSEMLDCMCQVKICRSSKTLTSKVVEGPPDNFSSAIPVDLVFR
jgi:hypothetical protein